MSQAQPWYSYGVTQAHGVNGELGIDIGTPQGTPITDLLPGVVTDTSYGPWGGDVHVVTTGANGKPVFEEFLHLDQILVSAGQTLGIGDLIGYSGGQNVGGSHPADPQFSSGPHTEFGLYTSLTANAQTSIDPTSFIQQLVQGIAGTVPSGATSSDNTQTTALSANPPSGLGPGIGTVLPAGVTAGVGTAINALNPLAGWKDLLIAMFSRTLWSAAGWSLVLLGIIIFFFGGSVAGDRPVNHAVRGAKTAALLAK